MEYDRGRASTPRQTNSGTSDKLTRDLVPTTKVRERALSFPEERKDKRKHSSDKEKKKTEDATQSSAFKKKKKKKSLDARIKRTEPSKKLEGASSRKQSESDFTPLRNNDEKSMEKRKRDVGAELERVCKNQCLRR